MKLVEKSSIEKIRRLLEISEQERHYQVQLTRENISVDRLNSLYSPMYQVPVAARGMGLHEDYTVPLPASTPNEDFLQIIDDGIQVRNCNFVQLTELVR